MKLLFGLFAHSMVKLATLLGPRGVKAVVVQNLFLKTATAYGPAPTPTRSEPWRRPTDAADRFLCPTYRAGIQRSALAGSIGTPRNRFFNGLKITRRHMVPHWTPSGGVLLRLSATSCQVKQTRLDNW
jgi:hypothetical protein